MKTAKNLDARVGPASQDNSMDRIEQEGPEFFKTNGVHSSRAKAKDGDESRAMASVMGNGSGSWATMLDDGAENPYPTTVEALKTKNSRQNNDAFFPD